LATNPLRNGFVAKSLLGGAKARKLKLWDEWSKVKLIIVAPEAGGDAGAPRN